MTVGEMIAFPFSNSFAVERAKKGNQGEYMALYAIAFSLSHIFSHNAGMQMVNKFGFEFTLNVLTILAFSWCWYIVFIDAYFKAGIEIFLQSYVNKCAIGKQKKHTFFPA